MDFLTRIDFYLFLFSVFTLAFLFAYQKFREQKKLIRNAFSNYISPELVDEPLSKDHPDYEYYKTKVKEHPKEHQHLQKEDSNKDVSK